jgi:hypothetical protein
MPTPGRSIGWAPVQSAIGGRDAAHARARRVYEGSLVAADRQLVRGTNDSEEKAAASRNLRAANGATAVL